MEEKSLESFNGEGRKKEGKKGEEYHEKVEDPPQNKGEDVMISLLDNIIRFRSYRWSGRSMIFLPGHSSGV